MKYRLLGAIALICVGNLTAIAQHSTPAWVATYEASPATFDNLPPFPGMPKDPDPVTGTVRYRFGISYGGSQFVVRLSNELGDKPLKIAAASIAVAATDMNAVPGSMRRLTFNGKNSVEIAPGALILSDPIQLRVASLSDMLGSVYFTEPVKLLPIGAQMLLSGGDQVTSETFPNARKVFMRPTMTMVLVSTDRPARAIVALGDSITDGVLPSRTGGWQNSLGVWTLPVECPLSPRVSAATRFFAV